MDSVCLYVRLAPKDCGFKWNTQHLGQQYQLCTDRRDFFPKRLCLWLVYVWSVSSTLAATLPLCPYPVRLLLMKNHGSIILSFHLFLFIQRQRENVLLYMYACTSVYYNLWWPNTEGNIKGSILFNRPNKQNFKMHLKIISSCFMIRLVLSVSFFKKIKWFWQSEHLVLLYMANRNSNRDYNLYLPTQISEFSLQSHLIKLHERIIFPVGLKRLIGWLIERETFQRSF